MNDARFIYDAIDFEENSKLCPYCGRIMSDRESTEQRICNDCSHDE